MVAWPATLVRSAMLLAAGAIAGCEPSIVLGSLGQPDAASRDTAPPDIPPIEDCTAANPSGLLAATPPMGWNGWNAFDCMGLNEAKVLATVDSLVASGMQAAGYQYVNLDDCWEQVNRAADGTLVADPVRFPNGVDPIARYVHSKGFSFGIYSPTANCGNTPGSDGYEDKDAQTFAAWNADYLKYRICSPVSDLETRYRRMATALANTGRTMVFSIAADPFAPWMASVGQLWRVAKSIAPTWDGTQMSILNSVDQNVPLAAWARPGGFNDPDMLEVGNGALTENESRAHFTVWAVMSAPLLAGNDVTTMTETTRAILTNSEVIGIDQDPLGLQGASIRRDGDVQIFAKPLASCGARALVVFNRGTTTTTVTVSWPEIWLLGGAAAVRDLWAHADRGSVADGITVTVAPHDVVALKVVGSEPPRPQNDTYLSDIPWTYVSNGWGPVEIDSSNGEMAAGDGAPIRLRGRTYQKGLGAHAPSLIRYRLGQKCSHFTADIGVDDEVMGSGSVVFQVWADGEKLYDSAVMTGTTPPKHVDIDVRSRRDLRLFVGTTGGIDNELDHADWADARVTCGG